MMTRRSTLKTASALGLGMVTASCSSKPDYEDFANELWQKRSSGSPLSQLIHYATLAANSHNAQAWRFTGNDRQIVIAPDLTRALPAADPDNHHLFASLGCAAENLALAAADQGLSSSITFNPGGDGNVGIYLADNGAADALFAAIVKRQCTRADYDGRPVPTEELNALTNAGKIPGVEVMLIVDKARTENILDLIIRANTAQVEDSAFANELKSWIRFSEAEAIASGDGLYAACSGNPTMPGWLGRMMFGWVFSASGENEKYARQIRSSAGLAIFVSEKDDKEHWVAAGRSFQRFALQATTLNIRHSFVNQAVEVVSVRKELANLLGLGDRRADLIVRFGYGPLMPRSLRRPLKDVTSA